MKNVKIYSGEVKDLDDKGVVTFYFSKFGNIDSDGDIVEKGAFTKTIKDNFKRIKHFKNHNIYQLIGVPQEIKEDNEGAFARSQLILGTVAGKESYEEYKAGGITEHSFGFRTIKEERDHDAGINYLKELKLNEFSSLSAWGANPETNVIDIKSATDYMDYLLKMQKADLTDVRLKEIEETITKVLDHIKTLKETTHLEPDLKPFDTMDFIINNF